MMIEINEIENERKNQKIFLLKHVYLNHLKFFLIEARHLAWINF